MHLKLGKFFQNLAAPAKKYESSGWKGFGDWLGTRNIAPFLKKYRPFIEARKFAQSLGLKSQDEWMEFTKSSKMPEDIPCDARRTYKDTGWTSMGDWLGTGNVYRKTVWDFNKAVRFVNRLKLTSVKEWTKYYKGEINGLVFNNNLPTAPNVKYKDKGWKGWDHFLGKTK